MSTSPARSGTPSRLPARTRDRRSSMTALALLLVLLGALGSALLVYRSAERVNVLVAERDIPQGTAVTRDDFREVPMGVEAEGLMLTSANLEQVMAPGVVTQIKIPRDSAASLNFFMSASGAASPGGQRVGLTVPDTNHPAGLDENDVVRLLLVPEGGDGETTELVAAARVVDVVGDDDGGGQTNQSAIGTRDGLQMTVLVPTDKAPAVAGASASGRVAVVELPLDTKPEVDLLSADG